MGKMSEGEFAKLFPNDDACLEKLFHLRFGNLTHCPSCAKENPKFYRLKNKKCYSCGNCRHQIYPLKGTIMEKSTTSLVLWFRAIFEFSLTKQGVSIRRLSDRLGVTLKTAWRMSHKIRSIMKEDESIMLDGIVEIDETLIGGRARGKRGWGANNKTCVFGMIERGGKVQLEIVPNRKRPTLLPIIFDSIKKGATIYSDEFKAYRILNRYEYNHESIRHSNYQWAKQDCCTNAMEGFWGNLKKWIKGTHVWVSPKYLRNYLNEFTFRHNRRKDGINGIFNAILCNIIKVQ